MGVGLEERGLEKGVEAGRLLPLLIFLWKILCAHAAASAVILPTRYYVFSTHEGKSGVKVKKWIGDSAGSLFYLFPPSL